MIASTSVPTVPDPPPTCTPAPPLVLSLTPSPSPTRRHLKVLVGVFWPSMMTMRAHYVPEDLRSTIINCFRIPLNLFVCIILYNVSGTERYRGRTPGPLPPPPPPPAALHAVHTVPSSLLQHPHTAHPPAAFCARCGARSRDPHDRPRQR